MTTRRVFLRSCSVLSAYPFIDRISLSEHSRLPFDAFKPADYGHLIAPPENSGAWPDFRNKIEKWRVNKRRELGYTGHEYDKPEFSWAAKNFSCCFLMMYDLEFYDPQNRRYTVEKIVERGEREFGGYDSVVLWHAYPRIGIDERNQFDFYRDMPGGLSGVKEVVERFRTAGIRVFINYNPWDTATRREEKTDIELLIDIMTSIGADGIFLDTMKKANADFRPRLDSIRKGIVLEGELPAELDILPTHHLSWAQEFKDRYVPGVLRNKWYERRHMQHQINRWNRDHSPELQLAWMNGSGIMVWENVFGQWIAWSDRDKSVLRAMIAIQRCFHEHFISEDWTPLVPTKSAGIFASCWQVGDVRLWTLVNRNDRDIDAEMLTVQHSKGDLYFDLIAGQQVNPLFEGKLATLSSSIRSGSIGCFLACQKKNVDNKFAMFLAKMKQIAGKFNANTQLPPMKPDLKKVFRTALSTAIGKGMVEINPVTISQRYEFALRECGTDTSYPSYSMFRQSPMLSYDRMVHIPHIAVDVTPVTNRQYAAFLSSSGYRPVEPRNFLKHWIDGIPPKGKEEHPVVYVDPEDARAYAKWCGKRIPTEPEWQFAAQGYEQLPYPWGYELKDGYYNTTRDTTPVNMFEKGVSPFGCIDMCGNTWEITESEYADSHNRFCILKGGSFFEAKDSMWYTGGGPQPSAVSTKFLMLYPGLDRCSTVGFRCVQDLV